jgi:hypothetical protein
MRKEEAAETMAVAMVEHMREAMMGQIRGAARTGESYVPTVPMDVPRWLTENVRRP